MGFNEAAFEEAVLDLWNLLSESESAESLAEKRGEVRNAVHAVNLAYSEWAWEVDKLKHLE